MDFFKKITTQITEFFGGLSGGKKTAVIGTLIATVIGIFFLFGWANQQNYVPLMTNLNPEDSAAIIRTLRDKNIPFQVEQGGKAISVPPERMLDLRLEMASQGYPQSSVVGYELFDKQSLGVTSFVQKVNQKRALEGELMRTINSIRGVSKSRVHLALPLKSAFVEDQKKASASVIVDLEPGIVLTEKQVFGVVNLVSKAVEGMDGDDVVVVDSTGKTLSKNSGDALGQATTTQLDFQRKVENDYERRIEEMMARVVGDGRVVAKVTADVDFSQVSETATTFDQDGAAIRSVEKRSDVMTGSRPAPGGAAGALSNQPGNLANANPEIKNDVNKSNEVTNFEVPQTIKKVVRPQGSIKKISVAVVVDGEHKTVTDKDGKTLAKVDPWPAEKLAEFRSVIASAVALDPKRGDSLEIKNLNFQAADFEEANRILAEREQKDYIRKLGAGAIFGAIVLLFFFLVVRPFIKWLTENTIDSVDTFLPQTIEELEKMQKSQALGGMEDAIPILPDKVDPEKVEGDMIKEKIVTLVDNNPHKAALILRDWLHSHKYSGEGKDKKEGGKSA